MNISSLQTGAFEAIQTKMKEDANSPSPAAKLQLQPTLAQELRQQKVAVTSFVIDKKPVGFVNMHGEMTGKVLNVKA